MNEAAVASTATRNTDGSTRAPVGRRAFMDDRDTVYGAALDESALERWSQVWRLTFDVVSERKGFPTDAARTTPDARADRESRVLRRTTSRAASRRGHARCLRRIA